MFLVLLVIVTSHSSHGLFGPVGMLAKVPVHFLCKRPIVQCCFVLELRCIGESILADVTGEMLFFFVIGEGTVRDGDL